LKIASVFEFLSFKFQAGQQIITRDTAIPDQSNGCAWKRVRGIYKWKCT
jgi:hypothetical protein